MSPWRMLAAFVVMCVALSMNPRTRLTPTAFSFPAASRGVIQSDAPASM